MRALLALSLLLMCSTAVAGERRLAGEDVASTLQKLLEGTEAHLDRDSVSNGKRTARSYVALPQHLGGAKHTVSLPDQRASLGGMGDVVYRRNDVNLNKIGVATAGPAYVVQLFFEEEGKEILSQSSGAMASFGGGA